MQLLFLHKVRCFSAWFLLFSSLLSLFMSSPHLDAFSLSTLPPSLLQTPPLIIQDDTLESSHEISKEREFQMIVQNSLRPENHGHQLRGASKQRKPHSFDDFQCMTKEEAAQRARLQGRSGSMKESEVQKREKILVEVLKCKMWECLVLKVRYPKWTAIYVDIMDYEDALLWSHLFDQEEAFLLFSPLPSLPSSSSSSSLSGLSHHQKKCIWKTSIISPCQVGPWLESLLKCFQDTHCIEVMLHTGVVQSDPIPLDVSLNYHECTSWKSASLLGENAEVSSVGRFSLDVSFRISCSNIQYMN